MFITARQQSFENMSDQNKNVKATIQAVVFFDYPEEFVSKCAIDLKNRGEILNTTILLIECELQSSQLLCDTDSLENTDLAIISHESNVESTGTSLENTDFVVISHESNVESTETSLENTDLVVISHESNVESTGTSLESTDLVEISPVFEDESTGASLTSSHDPSTCSVALSSHSSGYLSLPLSAQCSNKCSSLETTLSNCSNINKSINTPCSDYVHENTVSSFSNVSSDTDTYFSASSSLNSVPEIIDEDSVDGAHLESVMGYSNDSVDGGHMESVSGYYNDSVDGAYVESVSGYLNDGLDEWPSSNLPTVIMSSNDNIENLPSVIVTSDDGFKEYSSDNLPTIKNIDAACSMPLLNGISSEHKLFRANNNDKSFVTSLATSQPVSIVCEKYDSALKSSGASILSCDGSCDTENLDKASAALNIEKISKNLQDVVWDGETINTSQAINKDRNKEIEKFQEQRTKCSSKVSSVSVEDIEFKKICFTLVEKEHTLLEKSRLCSTCSLRPRDTTFLPCGHFETCRYCAEPIFTCPKCNVNILATVMTYLS